MERDEHFQQGGADYAQHRPTYPAALANVLAELAPSRTLALDVGCGTGQLSVLLAEEFDYVVATDVSADQIANATARPQISYRVGAAEKLDIDDASADLIVVAQAAHWFDLPAFFAEATRVAAPDCVLALVTYGVMEIDGAPNERFQKFYWDEIGPYWPPERRHVETQYRDLPFPVGEMPAPQLAIERHWSLDDLMGYIGTWSATKQVRKVGAEALIAAAEAELRPLWGNGRLLVRWPIAMRIGRLNPR